MGCCLSFCHARPDTFPRRDVPEPSPPVAARQLLMTTIPSPTDDQVLSSNSSCSSMAGGDLRRVTLRWTSPVELDRDSWARRRREFWETAPSFGGSAEVWQALRMAIAVGGGPMDEEQVVKQSDLATAQTILRCAGVVLPHGNLKEAYDERGYRYVIPVYCLADPINLASGPQEKTGKALSLPADRIMVRMPDGQDICLTGLTADWTVAQLKEQLGQPIRLFWQGRGPLADQTRLIDLGWTDPESRLQAWPLNTN